MSEFAQVQSVERVNLASFILRQSKGTQPDSGAPSAEQSLSHYVRHNQTSLSRGLKVDFITQCHVPEQTVEQSTELHHAAIRSRTRI